MLPVVAIVAGKTIIKIAGGVFLYGGIKRIHDHGKKIGHNRGMEYRIQEIILLRRLLHEFQMTRDALKDRLHALVAPYAHIDICDPQFFSKTLEVLEKNLPNWRDKL